MTSPQDVLRLHLTEPETRLYLALLKLGKARVTTIAKHLGMDRSLTYFHLRHLQDKGYVRESRSGSIKQFVATAPSTIAKQWQEQSSAFATILPLLERMGHPDPQAPTIEVFESRAGFLRVYEEIAALEPGSMFRVLEGKRALTGELSLLTPQEWQRFFEKITERKIETKGLFTETAWTIPQGTLSKANHALLQKRVWHMRLIDESRLPFDELLLIYGHKMAFLFPEDHLVITLEHAGVCRVLTTMFEALFLMGTPAKDGWR